LHGQVPDAMVILSSGADASDALALLGRIRNHAAL
jgi:hypothetical protein